MFIPFMAVFRLQRSLAQVKIKFVYCMFPVTILWQPSYSGCPCLCFPVRVYSRAVWRCYHLFCHNTILRTYTCKNWLSLDWSWLGSGNHGVWKGGGGGGGRENSYSHEILTQSHISHIYLFYFFESQLRGMVVYVYLLCVEVLFSLCTVS